MKWLVLIIIWFIMAILIDWLKHRKAMSMDLTLEPRPDGRCHYYDVPGGCYNNYKCKDCDADQYEH